MSACKFKEPEFKDVGNGHFVACHKYDEEVMSNMAYYDSLEKEEERAEKKQNNASENGSEKENAKE